MSCVGRRLFRDQTFVLVRRSSHHRSTLCREVTSTGPTTLSRRRKKGDRLRLSNTSRDHASGLSPWQDGRMLLMGINPREVVADWVLSLAFPLRLSGVLAAFRDGHRIPRARQRKVALVAKSIRPAPGPRGIIAGDLCSVCGCFAGRDRFGGLRGPLHSPLKSEYGY